MRRCQASQVTCCNYVAGALKHGHTLPRVIQTQRTMVCMEANCVTAASLPLIKLHAMATQSSLILLVCTNACSRHLSTPMSMHSAAHEKLHCIRHIARLMRKPLSLSCHLSEQLQHSGCMAVTSGYASLDAFSTEVTATLHICTMVPG